MGRTKHSERGPVLIAIIALKFLKGAFFLATTAALFFFQKDPSSRWLLRLAEKADGDPRLRLTAHLFRDLSRNFQLHFSAIVAACLIAGIALATEGTLLLLGYTWAPWVTIFLTGVWMFATTDLIDVGIYHLITAAALILIPVTRGRLRLGYIAGMVVLIVAQFVHTHFVIKPDDYAHLDPVNKIYTALYGVWLVGTGLITLFRGNGEEGGPLTKLMAYSAILVWVLGAAAGRWIAFQ